MMRKSPLKSGKPMKRSNPKRQKRLFRENFGGKDYVEYIKSLPCAICRVRWFSEAAHVVSRGAGGKASDLVPLCGPRMMEAPAVTYIGCHRRFDVARWRLPEGTEERLLELAAKLYADYHSTPNTNKGSDK